MADLKRAQLYRGIHAWVTRHGEGGEQWIFECIDGGFDSFRRAAMLKSLWWRFCQADDVLSIEASLRPAQSWADRFVDLPISFVACSDRKAGGKLIPGSRLSAFFEGEAGYEAARTLCAELRAQRSDVGVFQFSSIAVAERALQGIDVHAEWMERRTQEIIAEQNAARVRLGFALPRERAGAAAKLQGA